MNENLKDIAVHIVYLCTLSILLNLLPILSACSLPASVSNALEDRVMLFFIGATWYTVNEVIYILF